MVQEADLLAEWTIDELATVAGVPTRTIREYQRLELLAPPRRDGRVGRYGPEHRARLSIIGRLRERGYSLAAIGDLMGSWEQGHGLGSVLGVNANPAVLDESPSELSGEQLVDLVPAFNDGALLEKATAAGLLHRRGDSTVVRSVAVLELVALVTDAGLPAESAVELAAGIRKGAASIAGVVVDSFVEGLWPRREEVDLAAVVARARLLVAQAAASLVVHELGVALGSYAESDPSGELAALVESVAIGQVRHITTPLPGADRQ